MLLLGGRLDSGGLVCLRRLRRCGFYEWDELFEQLSQGVGRDLRIIVRSGRPVVNEIATGAEFAKRLCGVVFVAEQLPSFVSILESVVGIHR
ncbi:MAG: hypothetical protein JXN61_08785 [Sedimentisphaerales bacterium]|nr:hypothetical protein [Sedimentisphaerales bacterium]